MVETSARTQLATVLSYIAATVIILLPFHAFLTTWAGSNFGNLDAWRIWKELVIFFVLLPASAWLAFKTPAFRAWLRTSRLAWLVAAYLILNVLLGLWALTTGRVNVEAFIYGFFVDLRFLGFMAITFVLALRSPLLPKYWWKLLLVPAAIVVALGCLQLVLPANFLEHFGYGPNTIPAVQTIDQKDNYQRIQSTLRGANPLGAYLVLVGMGLLAYRLKNRIWQYGFVILFLVTFFFTYSRSAWLGALLAAVVYLGVSYHAWIKSHAKALLLLGLAGLVLVGCAAIYLRENDQFENIVFHSNEQSKSSESSNMGRNRALWAAAQDVAEHPLGMGPGTAGPASFRNDGKPKIAENYFLQIGQETGWLGLALFGAICISLGAALWHQRADKRAAVLLAALVGLTFVNLLSHAWADDTLGLLYFGLAGVVLADVILNKKRKRHDQTKAKKITNS